MTHVRRLRVERQATTVLRVVKMCHGTNVLSQDDIVDTIVIMYGHMTNVVGVAPRSANRNKKRGYDVLKNKAATLHTIALSFAFAFALRTLAGCYHVKQIFSEWPRRSS